MDSELKRLIAEEEVVRADVMMTCLETGLGMSLGSMGRMMGTR